MRDIGATKSRISQASYGLLAVRSENYIDLRGILLKYTSVQAPFYAINEVIGSALT